MLKEYIERLLHMEIQLEPYNDTKNLPLVLRGKYTLQRMNISGHEVLLAEPSESSNLSVLRKEARQLEMSTGLRVVMCLRAMNYYCRDVLIRENIPFVWYEHQIYLPFIGILLDSKTRTAPLACEKLSFLTQKILLTALYENWQNMTVTKTADILGVTKTSISRCFDELEALSIPYVHTKSRGRFLSVPADRKEMWETIRPVLRNPVIAAYSLKEKVTKNCRLSGISALAYYTMLESEQVPLYAVQKKDIASLDIIRSKISSAGETPGCIVHETGYQIDFEDGKAMDPLSVVLSLSGEEKEDPRISLAIDEMLEEFVWSKAWKDSGSISGNTPISMY